MNKIFSFAALILASFTLSAQSVELRNELEKVNAFFYQLDRFYVDSIDNNDLITSVIRKTLEDLDPHSVYIPAEELKKMNEPLVGNFDGIGIQFNILKDTILVISPIAGGPSEKLGIRAGDKIVEIEDTLVAGIGITNNDVVSKLRGKKGTVVNVGISRKGEKNVMKFAITRDKIPIYSVDAGFMLNDETGYIKVNRFAANTVEEFKAKLAPMQEKGMKNLVLDLQGNGGGYLKTAIDLADEFLGPNKLIVYTKGRSFPKEESRATIAGNFEEGKLIVLIDEGSASASEIVSGAIQDWDRGLIVGRRSFGKGLVQKPFMLPDGSAMRLTISRYYTPSGRCIQRNYGDGIEAYYKERYDRYTSGELFSLDSISFPDSLKFFTDHKRIVYGGGGITPDLFTPLDTSNNSTMLTAMIRKGITNSFSLDFVEKDRRKLGKLYPDVIAFKQNFKLSEDNLAELKAMAEKEGIEWNESDFKKSEAVITARIRALIARNIFDSDAFYYVISDINEALQDALEILDSGNYDKQLAANKP